MQSLFHVYYGAKTIKKEIEKVTNMEGHGIFKLYLKEMTFCVFCILERGLNSSTLFVLASQLANTNKSTAVCLKTNSVTTMTTLIYMLWYLNR